MTEAEGTEYPDPSEADLNDPTFSAIWRAIKDWDISRDPANHRVYSGATGNDVMRILLALRAAGYIPASRLLAAEAELGKLKAELKRIAESWLSNAGALRLEGARYETYEGLENCADELLRAAPPSPPVAPEPAQEAKRAEFMALAKRVGAPGVTVLAGSGEPAQEAGGVERVTAEQAWVLLTSIMARQDNAEQRQQMRRFVAQQEQSEREAAGLREQVEGYRTAWSEACGEREKAKLAAEAAETEAEMRRLFLVTANTDRDAERTQKEALRAELEKQHGYVLQLQESHGRVAAERDAKAELAKEWEALRNNVYRSYREATDERDALRTENEGLKAKLRERDICWHCKDTLLEPDGRPHCENCPAEGDCDDAACSEDGCREERAQQPAEAAPVSVGVELDCDVDECMGKPVPALCEKHLQHLRSAAAILRTQPGMAAVELHHAWLDRDEELGFTEPEAAPVAKEWRCPQCNDTLSGAGCIACVYKRQAPVAKAEAPSEPAGWVPATTGGAERPDPTAYEPSWADYVLDCINNAIGEPHDPATDALIDAISSMRVAMCELERRTK